jgi:Arc/MetJ-type ribon-helix-helix transcriptional regulator
VTTQIAVRLPDELVAFLDELVRKGQASSRAAAIARALEREKRRQIAERDAAILARTGTDQDLDTLARHAAAINLDDLE